MQVDATGSSTHGGQCNAVDLITHCSVKTQSYLMLSLSSQ